ncbi:MAG: TIGR00341 family protein [Rikenellaceae bacterium]
MENNNYSFWDNAKEFLSGRFSLREDSADQSEVIENIHKSIDFKGTNLWILIFAIVIASVGLNVNSTAVIIGAMLVSPLMGPIMGIGLSLGINDFETLKRSFKNFLFAVGVSLLVSTIYFSISPALTTQSELLARTTPTIWDVLIATFGGLAGMVAQTRKDRTSTVIPGVAIATALMPPICTAGFGLATGNMAYFGGALYLFFINAVFIAFAAFFIVRFLQYKHKQQLDPKRAKKVKRYITTIITITLVPSIILALGIVERAVFETNAKNYIDKVLVFDNSEVINSDIKYNRKGSSIDVMLIGDNVSQDVISVMTNQLKEYKLTNTTLHIRQASNGAKLNDSQMQNILLSNVDIIEEKNAKINELSSLVDRYIKDTIPSGDIARELASLWPQFETFTINKANIENSHGVVIDKTIICIITSRNSQAITNEDKHKLTTWLSQRTKTKNIKLIIE